MRSREVRVDCGDLTREDPPSAIFQKREMGKAILQGVGLGDRLDDLRSGEQWQGAHRRLVPSPYAHLLALAHVLHEHGGMPFVLW